MAKMSMKKSAMKKSAMKMAKKSPMKSVMKGSMKKMSGIAFYNLNFIFSSLHHVLSFHSRLAST